MTAAADAATPPSDQTVTAAIVVIGDEILSGRTADKNIHFIANYLTAVGIDLKEVRVVPDEHDRIVEAVNAVRPRYTYVFTTGGIGPTHDDITADAIAAAFGVGIDVDPRILDILRKRYPDKDITPGRLHMARIPFGADLIENRASGLPGFRIGNVHVMAGVPSVMQAMMDAVGPTLEKGRPLMSETIDAGLPEGVIAAPLGAIQKDHPDTMIGSYPSFDGNRFHTRIVVRARHEAILRPAVEAVEAMCRELRGER